MTTTQHLTDQIATHLKQMYRHRDWETREVTSEDLVVVLEPEPLGPVWRRIEKFIGLFRRKDPIENQVVMRVFHDGEIVEEVTPRAVGSPKHDLERELEHYLKQA